MNKSISFLLLAILFSCPFNIIAQDLYCLNRYIGISDDTKVYTSWSNEIDANSINKEDFALFRNGNPIIILNVELNPNDASVVILKTNTELSCPRTGLTLSYSHSNMKEANSTIEATSFSNEEVQFPYGYTCPVDVVYIPDTSFEKALIQKNIDFGPIDGFVLKSRIENITHLTISNYKITDLTGIEGFVSLTNLNCMNNDIVELDLTGLTQLDTVWARNNDISTVDISSCPNLILIELANNNLDSIDVSNNLNLENLALAGATKSKFKNLDLSNNSKLKSLSIGNNNMTELDISHCPNLLLISGANNNFTHLDFSKNPLIETLWLNDSNLDSLDFTKNPKLISLHIDNVNISYLNIKNGNNLNMTHLETTNNPNLDCIIVDDPDALTELWITNQKYGFEFDNSVELVNVSCGQCATKPDVPIIIDNKMCEGATPPTFISNSINTIWASDKEMTTLLHTGYSYTPTLTGSYDLVVYAAISDNNCNSDTISATLHIIPTPSFSISESNYQTCISKLTIDTLYGLNFFPDYHNDNNYSNSELHWYFGNQTYIGDTLILNSLDLNLGNNTIYTQYELTSNDAYTCMSNIIPIEVNIDNCVATNLYTPNRNNDLQIFPNPISEEVNIILEEKIESVLIINSNGQEILKTNKTLIELNELKDGVYYIVVNTKNRTLTKQFIKK